MGKPADQEAVWGWGSRGGDRGPHTAGAGSTSSVSTSHLRSALSCSVVFCTDAFRCGFSYFISDISQPVDIRTWNALFHEIINVLFCTVSMNLYNNEKMPWKWKDSESPVTSPVIIALSWVVLMTFQNMVSNATACLPLAFSLFCWHHYFPIGHSISDKERSVCLRFSPSPQHTWKGHSAVVSCLSEKFSWE